MAAVQRSITSFGAAPAYPAPGRCTCKDWCASVTSGLISIYPHSLPLELSSPPIKSTACFSAQIVSFLLKRSQIVSLVLMSCVLRIWLNSSLIREPTGVVFSICSSFLESLYHTSHVVVHSWRKRKESACIPYAGILQFNIYEDWVSSHLKGQAASFTMCGIYYVNIVNSCFQELIWCWCWKALCTIEILWTSKSP